MNLIISDNDGTQNVLPTTSLVTTNQMGKNTETSTNKLIRNITIIVPVGMTETLTELQ